MARPAQPLPEADLTALEAEMTALWGHMSAAESRFLALIAEFDGREGYVRHGLAGTAQWLNWQCGIGKLAARERVRTVRALTCVATPENEAILLQIALNGTAHHVEQLVRRYSRVRRWKDAARAQTRYRRRSLSHYYEEDGSMIVVARLSGEVGALVAKSLQMAMDVVENQTQSNVSAESAPGQAWRSRKSCEG